MWGWPALSQDITVVVFFLLFIFLSHLKCRQAGCLGVTVVHVVCVCERERSVILVISVVIAPLLLFAPSLTRQTAKPVGRAALLMKTERGDKRFFTECLLSCPPHNNSN